MKKITVFENRIKARVAIILALVFISGWVLAGDVDTLVVHSASMNKDIHCVVIKPGNYKKKKSSFPVLYLLHGYSGSWRDWIIKVPDLKTWADQYQFLIVCPDGGYSSWYFNSPIDGSYQYETHVATEVVNYVDEHYKTIPDSAHRAITGLSMGGHGAMYLALRHPDIFGAAGSLSGGVDLSESVGRFDIAKRIGDTATHAGDWHDRSIVSMIEKYTTTPVKIIFDCGINDIFIKGNRKLNQQMLRLKIPHQYIERPGIHNWDYWKESLPYELIFFKQFFNASPVAE